MRMGTRWPVALTIAGSDSGGGAGIQADLKVFAAFRVHGTSAITCLTAQNPKGVRAIQPARADVVRRQIEAVLEELAPAAVKTGMLYSATLIRAVVRALAAVPELPVVVDPVMVSTSGVRLLQVDAVRALTETLLPRACLITPNLDEAGLLSGRPVTTVEEARAAAHELQRRFGVAVLLKGGHLRGLREAVDFYFDGDRELLLSAPFARGVSTHGTGCTYSAAITALLARGLPLQRAVAQAKSFVTRAIHHPLRIGRHQALNCSVSP